MTLNELIEAQKSFDNRHGWKIATSDDERLNLISRDIIGLVGEFGEFANQIKKIQLMDFDRNAVSKELVSRHSNLSEELIDTLIYLVRIAGHLNIDLEKTYREKLKVNDKKYSRFAGRDQV
jgi:NTP pyrophosphatase (non-canonical NTP hydrolase)